MATVMTADDVLAMSIAAVLHTWLRRLDIMSIGSHDGGNCDSPKPHGMQLPK